MQKKKVLGIIYGSLWVILLKGAMTFLISLKGAICKKVWETLIYMLLSIRKKSVNANN